LLDVHKFKKPGSKKVYYECMHDTKLIVRKKMAESHESIHSLIKLLDESIQRLSVDNDPDAARVREYLAQMKREYERKDNEYTALRALTTAERLRRRGYRVDMDHRQSSMKTQLKRADRLRARLVLLAGEHEIETGKVAGHMGARALTLIQEWREMHRVELLADWRLAEQKRSLHRIPPLE
jgi:histidyl-tRNA synthetase